MRSRYSAYVLGLDTYLLETWHASVRPAAVEAADSALRWLGLDIRRHAVLDADRAQVEFVARCKLAGRAQRLHEISHFVREAGVWYYSGAEQA